MVNLATYGPLLAVKLWVPRQAPSTVEPINALAEINTAYSQTFIQEGVATSLGLEPVGIVKITTATKPAYEAYLFNLRIVLPQSNRAFEVVAAEVPYMLRPHARIKCLIGRDILRYCILTYNGPLDTFQLQF